MHNVHVNHRHKKGSAKNQTSHRGNLQMLVFQQTSKDDMQLSHPYTQMQPYSYICGTCTVEYAVVHLAIGASTSASSFFDCNNHWVSVHFPNIDLADAFKSLKTNWGNEQKAKNREGHSQYPWKPSRARLP